ncbi:MULTISPECIES: succinate dehydrogenase, hydrophobic membrane anchor protein [Sphingomonadaceae]|uniref:Succinate dehydrogenase hydrophobic membrane anchor subunit n=1 Tax=Sphingomonas bisphenolicum TaxID=296544 RepID=A0ABM7G2G5_9SPHN|nr:MULTISPECIES: succinate dehydrogenase, hydrophobic membrane anchor protein [Sphingomonadaceae]MBA4092292.1 succinate dehydrogenase, hydrophobic membrane anchor protein [Sphingobium sp.]MBZ9648078.1 succinate dehydrogenase, hydrophobic membrane anchor protein [Sphingobium sp. 3R8]BBF69166.1 succinate dehydrogenase, hydrophobic membrane anchor protein [Sphingomonas bisphenolicum]
MGNGTGIGRVRGLGSAHHGAHHWLAQRYTAVGNLLLTLWLLFSLLSLPGLDYESVVGWIANPVVAVPLMLMIVSIFWHLRLGMQVMLEDYVHDKGLAFFSMLLLNFYALGGAAAGIFAIAKIAFIGVVKP